MKLKIMTISLEFYCNRISTDKSFHIQGDLNPPPQKKTEKKQQLLKQAKLRNLETFIIL